MAAQDQTRLDRLAIDVGSSRKRTCCDSVVTFRSFQCLATRQMHIPAPIRRGPAFPSIDGGCNFYRKVQAEHPQASRSRQPSRCPAPRKQLNPVTQ
jgi:hypothetical protein